MRPDAIMALTPCFYKYLRLGPRKEAALLARFSGIEGIRSASRAELDVLVGMTAASKVLERLA
jgi:hypothetical protein